MSRIIIFYTICLIFFSNSISAAPTTAHQRDMIKKLSDNLTKSNVVTMMFLINTPNAVQEDIESKKNSGLAFLNYLHEQNTIPPYENLKELLYNVPRRDLLHLVDEIIFDENKFIPDQHSMQEPSAPPEAPLLPPSYQDVENEIKIKYLEKNNVTQTPTTIECHRCIDLKQRVEGLQQDIETYKSNDASLQLKCNELDHKRMDQELLIAELKKKQIEMEKQYRLKLESNDQLFSNLEKKHSQKIESISKIHMEAIHNMTMEHNTTIKNLTSKIALYKNNIPDSKSNKSEFLKVRARKKDSYQGPKSFIPDDD